MEFPATAVTRGGVARQHPATLAGIDLSKGIVPKRVRLKGASNASNSDGCHKSQSSGVDRACVEESFQELFETGSGGVSRWIHDLVSEYLVLTVFRCKMKVLGSQCLPSWPQGFAPHPQVEDRAT